jgi:hypothetical protein
MYVRYGTKVRLITKEAPIFGELRKAEVQAEKHTLPKIQLLKEQAMYSCGRNIVLSKLGLQDGCCNVGWNEFCRPYVFPANCDKM